MRKLIVFLCVVLTASVSLALPQIVFSTYLGGDSSVDTCDNNGVAVDAQGNTYVVGNTTSTNFVRTIEIPPGTTNGSFILKFAPDGSLVYATMLGECRAGSIAVDTNGCAYITGTGASTNFPTTPGVFQPKPSSISWEAFLAKLDAEGQLVYATYLGGAGTDEGEGIAVDNEGHAYITGWTASTNLPVTPGAYQTTLSSYDNFITKFTPDATGLVYSTYAGSGQPFAITVDSNGHAYITGRSDGGIPDVNAIQPSYGGGTYDAFIVKMNEDGSDVLYASYFGGSSGDEGQDIKVDAAGNMYLVGFTDSLNLLMTNSFQPANGLGGDAFFAKFDPTGTNLVFSSYLGKNQPDEGYAIEVDSNEMFYVAGWTTCNDFPIRNAIQPAKGSNDFISTFKPDVFVAQFAPDGSNLIYSTYWGGGKTEYGYDMALAPDGSVSVVGHTESVTSFPVYAAIQGNFAGGERDCFVARFPPIDIDAPEMSYSSGIASGNIAIVWYGEAGWEYSVEYTESLLSPVQWDPLPGFTNLFGVGSLMTATDAVGVIERRVYRIVTE